MATEETTLPISEMTEADWSELFILLRKRMAAGEPTFTKHLPARFAVAFAVGQEFERRKYGLVYHIGNGWEPRDGRRIGGMLRQ